MKKFREVLSYLGLATLEHSLILGIVWLLPVALFFKMLIAIAMFSLIHWSNGVLMYMGFILSCVFYSMFFVFLSDYSLIVFLALLFTQVIGALYMKSRGLDLRYLWLSKRWPKF